MLLHGVLMNGSLWNGIVEGLRDRYRCIVPELPFGAHSTPMPKDADLSLGSITTMIAEFLVELDLHDVTLVCNDWGSAQLVVSPGGSDRVANLVLVSCTSRTARSRTSGEYRLGLPIDSILLRNSRLHELARF